MGYTPEAATSLLREIGFQPTLTGHLNENNAELISINLSVSDDYSQELNEHYFQKDYPTDVLTIPLYKDLASIHKLDKNKHEILGDLFLNRKLIKKHAKKFTKTLTEEYQLVLVHGLLHLIGYSHNDPKKLSNIENTILKKVWNE